MKELSHTSLGGSSASLAFLLLNILPPFLARGQTITENAQNLNIGFNGQNRHLPYMTAFYTATNTYYESIGRKSMPGSRHC